MITSEDHCDVNAVKKLVMTEILQKKLRHAGAVTSPVH